MSNDSIDRLAEQYATTEAEEKVYIKAQQATIITQTRQLNDARKKLEELAGQVEHLTIENTRLKALNPSLTDTTIADEESICIVQLALLNNMSMQRELTLEETKKTEIYSKILLALRGKKAEKEDTPSIGNLSNEELLAAMKAMGGDN